MTIPIIPGPFSGLGQGLERGLDAYNQQKQLQYDQARQGFNSIAQLVQLGILKPEQLGAPGVAQMAQTAKIPALDPGNIVPSVKAEMAGRTVDRLQATTPGSTEESLMLDLPTLGQIGEADFIAQAGKIRDEVMSKYPEVGRKLAGVFAPGATANQERATEASAASKEYDYAADNFVAQAGLAMPRTPDGTLDVATLAQQAKQAAAGDPQYAQLVANGQMSDEYFARAAQDFARMDENQRLKWADVAARRAAAEREVRLFYDQQRKSYDVQVQQLQNTIKENNPTIEDLAFLNSAKKKLAKGVGVDKLTSFEQNALRKVAIIEDASAQIENLTGERQDILDRFIDRANPINPSKKIIPPNTAAPGARRQGQGAPAPTAPQDKISKLRQGLQSGQLTRQQIMNSPALTPEEKAQVLGTKP